MSENLTISIYRANSQQLIVFARVSHYQPQDLLSYVGMLYSQLYLKYPRGVLLLVAAL